MRMQPECVKEGYLFGYPDESIIQYKNTDNLESKYKRKLIELKKEKSIKELSYLTTFIYYIPKLEKENMIESINKGKNRYVQMKKVCKENDMDDILETIETERKREEEWLRNIDMD
jgi:RNA polymerase-interacting CarD/CdnL/TRCF family regulator